MSESFSEKCVKYALKHLGKPYCWGANGPLTWTPAGLVSTQSVCDCPEAFDCVGLVKDAVFDALGPDLRATWNAQTMHDRLPSPLVGDAFALCFYGPSLQRVSHVAFDLGNNLRLQSAGGDQTTKTYRDAVMRGACVQIGFEQRSDLLGRRSLAALKEVK